MTDSTGKAVAALKPPRIGSDVPFVAALIVLGGSYVLLIALMVAADFAYTSGGDIMNALRSPEVRYSIKLSLLSCSITTLLALWVAVPLAYLMSRFKFRGSGLVDAILDVPVVLPPLVIGLSLLILFNYPPFAWISRYVVLEIPAVILAQFSVATAFAVKTMRVTFDQITTRQEQVALTLGCNRSQAFWRIVLPQARRGIVSAGILAWARALGEFGPILVFAGSTRFRVEVLPTTVYLEMQSGNLRGMLAVSMIMIVAALIVLVITRYFGLHKLRS
jgi:molybdate transport system permease protein